MARVTYANRSKAADAAEAVGLIVIAIVKTVIAFFITWAIEGFFLMLAVGQLHAWWNAVPSMGYYTAMSVSFWLAAFLTVPVGSAIRANIRKSVRA